MKTTAEVLSWVGQPQTIMLGLVLVHGFVIWHWRHDRLKQRLSLGWLILFMAISLTVFYETIIYPALGWNIITPLSYGMTEQEALSQVLLHWRLVWLPIYIPWLTVWLIGLMSIPFLPKAKRLIAFKSK